MGISSPESPSREEAKKQVQSIAEKVGADLKSGKINPDEAAVALDGASAIVKKEVGPYKSPYLAQEDSIRKCFIDAFGERLGKKVGFSASTNFWHRLESFMFELDEFRLSQKKNNLSEADKAKILNELEGSRIMFQNHIVDLVWDDVKEIDDGKLREQLKTFARLMAERIQFQEEGIYKTVRKGQK